MGTSTVVVLGASAKPERYSHKALVLLRENGYRVVPVHPVLESIDDFGVVHSLDDIDEPVHTVSLYVNSERLEAHLPAIQRMKPGRVIFNPGTESARLRDRLEQSGIRCIEACTLVLLRTGQFERA
ncbi:MAG: CoA-binding protein [Chitinivibrionales bacterium]|nr:CoA-binding protein [Chitinivibrionales bacterium]